MNLDNDIQDLALIGSKIEVKVDDEIFLGTIVFYDNQISLLILSKLKRRDPSHVSREVQPQVHQLQVHQGGPYAGVQSESFSGKPLFSGRELQSGARLRLRHFLRDESGAIGRLTAAAESLQALAKRIQGRQVAGEEHLYCFARCVSHSSLRKGMSSGKAGKC